MARFVSSAQGTDQIRDERGSADSHSRQLGSSAGLCPHTAGHVQLAALVPAPRPSIDGTIDV